MREILFRGKVITSGEWVVGNYNQNVLDRGFDTIEDLENFPYLHYGVEYNTVGQYTGLTDKNGKRIFEGDIIKTHYANTPKSDFIEQVVFLNGRFCGMYESGNMKMWSRLPDKDFKPLAQDRSVYMEWCEVIGNIHDNPELIKED